MGKTLAGFNLNDDITNTDTNTNQSSEELEMMDMNYTSLKDLIPISPPSTPSPTGSWKEIPIKDPLLQHAAWAYLQPMVAAREEDTRKWWKLLREKCCGIFGCVNDMVLVLVYGLLSKHEDRVKLIE